MPTTATEKAEQLKRIAEETESIAKEGGLIGWGSGLNIILIMINIVLVLAALIAFGSAVVDDGVGVGVGALLLALELICLIATILVKINETRLDDDHKDRLKRLRAEVERKEKELRALVPGGAQGSGG